MSVREVSSVSDKRLIRSFHTYDKEFIASKKFWSKVFTLELRMKPNPENRKSNASKRNVDINWSDVKRPKVFEDITEEFRLLL